MGDPMTVSTLNLGLVFGLPGAPPVRAAGGFSAAIAPPMCLALQDASGNPRIIGSPSPEWVQ